MSEVFGVVPVWIVPISDNFLVTHEMGGLNIGENFEIISSYANKGEFKLNSEYLESIEDFYTVDSEGNLVISNSNFFYDETGISSLNLRQS